MKIPNENKESYRLKVETALNLISEKKAVVKIAFNDASSEEGCYLLNQLKDPNNIRPLDYVSEKDLPWVYNTYTREVEERKIKQGRGLAKKEGDPGYNFTKKLSTSLLQTHGKTVLFKGPEDTIVGFMFHLDKVRFKTDKDGNRKYIWVTNAYTFEKWWVGKKHHSYRDIYPSVSLENLQEKLDLFDDHNEMKVCLAKEALAAIFAPKDDVNVRLNALRTQHEVSAKLGVDLPILIISPAASPREYTITDQLRDLEAKGISEKLIKNFSIEKIKEKLKLKLVESSQDITQYFGLKNEKTIDTDLIIKKIIEHKNDEKFLNQLYKQLLGKEFSYLRGYKYFTNYYALINNERVSTSEEWAKIEKAFSLSLIYCVSHMKDSKHQQKNEIIKNVSQLCLEHRFIANPRKWLIHTNPSNSSRIFNKEKTLETSFRELDQEIARINPSQK